LTDEERTRELRESAISSAESALASGDLTNALEAVLFALKFDERDGTGRAYYHRLRQSFGFGSADNPERPIVVPRRPESSP